MNSGSIKEGDIVRVNKKGRRFHATVLGRDPKTREFKLLPIQSGITFFNAAAREIEDHWINRRRFSKKGT